MTVNDLYYIEFDTNNIKHRLVLVPSWDGGTTGGEVRPYTSIVMNELKFGVLKSLKSEQSFDDDIFIGMPKTRTIKFTVDLQTITDPDLRQMIFNGGTFSQGVFAGYRPNLWVIQEQITEIIESVPTLKWVPRFVGVQDIKPETEIEYSLKKKNVIIDLEIIDSWRFILENISFKNSPILLKLLFESKINSINDCNIVDFCYTDGTFPNNVQFFGGYFDSKLKVSYCSWYDLLGAIDYCIMRNKSLLWGGHALDSEGLGFSHLNNLENTLVFDFDLYKQSYDKANSLGIALGSGNTIVITDIQEISTGFHIGGLFDEDSSNGLVSTYDNMYDFFKKFADYNCFTVTFEPNDIYFNRFDVNAVDWDTLAPMTLTPDDFLGDVLKITKGYKLINKVTCEIPETEDKVTISYPGILNESADDITAVIHNRMYADNAITDKGTGTLLSSNDKIFLRRFYYIDTFSLWDGFTHTCLVRPHNYTSYSSTINTDVSAAFPDAYGVSLPMLDVDLAYTLDSFHMQDQPYLLSKLKMDLLCNPKQGKMTINAPYSHRINDRTFGKNYGIDLSDFNSLLSSTPDLLMVDRKIASTNLTIDYITGECECVFFLRGDKYQ